MLNELELAPTIESLPQSDWFFDPSQESCLSKFGFRTTPGGVHLSKTMMLADLKIVLETGLAENQIGLANAVVVENILAKPTGMARRLALSRLNTLYGILTPAPIQKAALRLWQRDANGRPLIALLCALAREPLLRVSSTPVLTAIVGTSVRWPDIAAAITTEHPSRYSPKMMKSLAQNCMSSWTQSGHLIGRVNKRRSLVKPSVESAAFAALLGSLAGFGGPALLRSPWMRLLDRSDTDLLNLLHRAESLGLIRVRAGGGVIQIDVCGPLAQTLEVPELVDC